MKKLFKLALATSLLLGSLVAQAQCNVSAWDVGTGAVAGGPGDANVQARYSGLCSMDGTGGFVTNNGSVAVGGPAGEAAMITRFYFLATGSGTATIFETYSENAATTPVYTVTYDGTNVTVTPNGAGGTAAVAPVGATNWHSVEIKWASGAAANSIELWVDSDAATVAADAAGTSATVATSIQAAKLGGIVPASYTTLLFDDYESRRTTSIGRLVEGDASGDGIVDITDVTTIVDDVFGTPSSGTPDCNEDGIVDISDITCAVDKVFGA